MNHPTISSLQLISIYLLTNVTMNNCCLKKTNSLKYLGVIIDHRLNWSQHITHVKNKVSKFIGIMYRAIRYLTKSSLKNYTFHTYILI